MCPCLRQGHISMYFSCMGTAISAVVWIRRMGMLRFAHREKLREGELKLSLLPLPSALRLLPYLYNRLTIKADSQIQQCLETLRAQSFPLPGSVLQHTHRFVDF